MSRKGAFGVYVHWPFCLSKCPYCDFNSHVRQGGIDEARFAAAFAAEIAATAARIGNRTVSTVFFGGGTPSLMEPGTVATILDAIGTDWTLASDAEITLEANPTSVEAARFRGYRASGVNRVSLGVQSLDDAVLRQLGRLHTAREALDAVAVARTIFDRISFDLIYARPGQTRAAWRDELAAALAEAGEHLSLYQLTIEPQTPFARLHAAGKLEIPDDDLALALRPIAEWSQAARTVALIPPTAPPEPETPLPVPISVPRYISVGSVCRLDTQSPCPNVTKQVAAIDNAAVGTNGANNATGITAKVISDMVMPKRVSRSVFSNCPTR